MSDKVGNPTSRANKSSQMTKELQSNGAHLSIQQGSTVRGKSPSQIAAIAAAPKKSLSYLDGSHFPLSSQLVCQNDNRSFSVQDTIYPSKTPTKALIRLFEHQTGTAAQELHGKPSKNQGSFPTATRLDGVESSKIKVPLSINLNDGGNGINKVWDSSKGEALQPAGLGKSMAMTANPRNSSSIIQQVPDPAIAARTSAPPLPPRHGTHQATKNLQSQYSNGLFPSDILKGKLEVSHNQKPNVEQAHHFDGSPTPVDSAVSEKGKSILQSLSSRQHSLTRRPVPSPLFSRAKSNSKRNEFIRSGSRNRGGILLAHSATPQLNADSLADAMVASSLASSRAPSPSRPPPPPGLSSKSRSLLSPSHGQEQTGGRKASPNRFMRQTLREPIENLSEDDRKMRNSSYLLKKRSNKYNEDTRNRWTDRITEHERKRYEGVWAANRGLLFPPADAVKAADHVLNIIVRDIWRRSRLPDDVLAEVWDLVDNEGSGRLARDEFVVGMWLIDQRLKGSKLPVKVSDSVWFSARGLSGIQVPK